MRQNDFAILKKNFALKDYCDIIVCGRFIMIRKTAFITGGSGGIGRACAIKFAQNGYNIATTYLTGSTENLKLQCEKLGVEFESYKMDLRDENCVKQTFDKVFKRFDYVDAVVCNAGTADKEMLFADVPQKNIDNLLNTNLRGTIICNQEAFRRFLKQKHGNIVNISSIFGINGGPCEAVYSATKGGIIALTKALAVEGAPFKIRVNAAAPGYIDTKMTAHFSEEEKAHAISMTPLARIGQGQDVADAVFFLANDSSSFITGEILTVSGGVLRF